MKQVLQNLRDGTTIVENVPIPTVRSGQILVRSLATLISAGTERMLVEFGNASYLNKARQQPEKVREVLDKIRTDGLIETVQAVRSKLDQPLTTGYCNVGVVADLGSGVSAFSIGQRIASNGNHAEYVSVPTNLCASVPDNVSDEQAAFVVLASIGLQGIRLVNPTIGENIVVTGLGLIGLLTVQMLRAQGCRVLGIDVDPARLAIAKQLGADVVDLSNGEDPISAAAAFSRGQGIDAVLITASTKSNEPVSQAARMCRKRGRIVLVGVTGLELSRADFYEKELTFQVSCSYGPGRYDPEYEEKGHDYPIGFVRWTEQRNFEAVLDLMSTKAIDVEPLISHRYSIDSAGEAYKLLSAREPSLGILLEYNSADRDTASQRIVELPRPQRIEAAASVVGIIGAGNYAGRVLIPAFKKTGASLHTLVSNGGVSSVHHGKKHGFAIAATDPDVVFDQEEINVVVVATRHDSHAGYVVKALEAGKHVFVEKPLAITNEELDEIDKARHKSVSGNAVPQIMVGFNRRFAPFIQTIKRTVSKQQTPLSLVYTCNAGQIDSSSWVQDPKAGGGRIVGEACHFIDLARYLAGAAITSVDAIPMKNANSSRDCRDTATITIGFENGSLAVINYFSNGHRSYPKERLEVYQSGNVIIMENFRTLRNYGSTSSTSRSLRPNRGRVECAQAFVDAVEGGIDAPIPYDEIMEVSRAAILAASQVQS